MWRFVAVLLCLGPVSAQDTSLAQQGLEVYKTHYCGHCHHMSAADSTGIFGPSHDAVGRIAEARILDPNYHGEATDAEGYVRESIAEPERYIVPGFALSRHRMPAYTHMGEDELTALVYFLLHAQEVYMSD